MVEQGGLPDQDHGPIRHGEETSAVAGVEELLDRVPFLPDYALPEAPPKLVRRFWLTRNEAGEVSEPWHDLPDDLLQRAHFGDICARETVARVALAFDAETRRATLTPEDVREICRQAIHEHSLCEEQFDLHDVYVCAEALYLREYDRWQRNEGWYEYTALPAICAALAVIGQVIYAEADPKTDR